MSTSQAAIFPISTAGGKTNKYKLTFTNISLASHKCKIRMNSLTKD